MAAEQGLSNREAEVGSWRAEAHFLDWATMRQAQGVPSTVYIYLSVLALETETQRQPSTDPDAQYLLRRYHVNITIALIKAGADVNARPAVVSGRAAIDGAAEHGRLDTVQLLRNAGAVSESNGFDKAIELARKNNHHTLADLLESG